MSLGKKIGIGVAIIVIILAVLLVLEFSFNIDGITEQISSIMIEKAVTDVTNYSELSGAVSIGMLLPLTGDLSSKGEENAAAGKLGAVTFNEYLDEIDAKWELVLISEDSATNPVIALDKISSLNARGVGIVVGVETSSNVKSVKGYTDSNNMMIISCCSTAPALAIADDSVYRMAPDDSFQGKAISKLVSVEGIESIIIVWRGDVWGDGLSKATKETFQSRGGTVSEGIRYNPESPEFSASTSLLAEQVRGAVDEYGADKVAIVFLAFGEVLQFMQSASNHDILDDVRWFGPDGYTKDYRLVDDPIGQEFSSTVQLTTVQVGLSDNDVVPIIEDHVLEVVGRVPNTYAHAVYDSVWLVGLAMLETESADPKVIKSVIRDVAERYDGSIGGSNLNEAGDLASADYDIWGIRDGEWKVVGKYFFTDDSVSIN